MSKKLTLDQVKYLFNHMPAKNGEMTAEVLAEVNVKITVCLFKNTETQDMESPDHPGPISLFFYNEDENQLDDDDFERSGFRADLVSPSGRPDDISYVDVQQLFHMDPSEPIWEVTTENSSFDEDEIHQCLSHMDET